jgi:hypothetical protein
MRDVTTKNATMLYPHFTARCIIYMTCSFVLLNVMFKTAASYSGSYGFGPWTEQRFPE